MGKCEVDGQNFLQYLLWVIQTHQLTGGRRREKNCKATTRPTEGLEKRKQGSYQDQLQQSQKLAFPDRGERICHYPIPSMGANLVTDSYQRIGVAAGIMDDAIITGVVRHRDGYSTVDLVLFFGN